MEGSEVGKLIIDDGMEKRLPEQNESKVSLD